MGCGVSRIDDNGMAFPSNLRPVFLPRLDEIAICKPLRDSNYSKKKLLSHESGSSKGSKITISFGEDSVVFDLNDKEIKEKHIKKPKEEASHNENSIATRIDDKIEVDMANDFVLREEGENFKPEYEEDSMEDVFMDVENDDDEDDDADNDDGGRMISNMNDEAYIGSPSFRIYYKNNEEDEHEKTAIGEDHVVDGVGADVVSSKESHADERVEKRSRKMRSFRKVFAKGLSVKSCYTSSNASHDRTHLLRDKSHC